MDSQAAEKFVRAQANPACLAAPCPHCGAASGEWCDDTFGRQHPNHDDFPTPPETETFYCIGYCHKIDCGKVFDTLGNSGLWLLKPNGHWHREAISLDIAVAAHVNLWERVRSVYRDGYRSWWRGRYLGITHHGIVDFPTPFSETARQTHLRL